MKKDSLILGVVVPALGAALSTVIYRWWAAEYLANHGRPDTYLLGGNLVFLIGVGILVRALTSRR